MAEKNGSDEIICTDGVAIRKVLAPAPFVALTLDAAIIAWIEAHPDAWARETFYESATRSGLGLPEGYLAAAIIGSMYRLGQWAAADTKRFITGLIAGEGMADEFEFPLRWATLRSGLALESLLDIFIESAQSLHAEMDWVLRDVNPDDAQWRSRYREVLLMRDRLESVSLLLVVTGDEHVRRLVALSIEFVDEAGYLFVNSLPHIHELSDDKILTRIATATCGRAWWADPVTFGVRRLQLSV